MDIVISGYAQKAEKSIALYQIHQNSIQTCWEAAVENASFVCQGKGYLYTVTESEAYAVVYCFRRTDQGFVLTDQKELEGGSLCHIAYSAKNNALFGACYGTGTVFSIHVENGRFGEILHQEIQYGAEPSEVTRAHCVLLNNAENELITVNIALDQICFYEVSQGKLTLNRVLEVPKGIGPRHAVLSETEELLYLITEYSNEILIYENKPEMKLIQRISTLPEGFSGTNFCSTLCFSKNHQYLYAANRGADTIALFHVNADGMIQKENEFDCGGNYPRHIIITRDGAHMVICNQNSDQVVIFKLDEQTGFLKEKMMEIPFRIPSGVLENEMI